MAQSLLLGDPVQFSEQIQGQIPWIIQWTKSSDSAERKWFDDRYKLLSSPGFIYLVEAVDSGGIFKVGKSKHPPKRLKQLPTKAPYDLKLHSAYETDSMVWAERMLHAELGSSKTLHYNYENFAAAGDPVWCEAGEYSSKRMNGEWFQGLYTEYLDAATQAFSCQLDLTTCRPHSWAIPGFMDIWQDMSGFSVKQFIGESIGCFVWEASGFAGDPSDEIALPIEYWNAAVIIDQVNRCMVESQQRKGEAA